jgi:hypothetical protein
MAVAFLLPRSFVIVGLLLGELARATAGEPLPPAERAEIYSRATNQFAEAIFYKPIHGTNSDLAFDLAPLLIEEAAATTHRSPGPTNDAGRGQFGALGISNSLPIVDRSRPAIYWTIDSAQLNGRAHTRISYAWCYSVDAPAKTNASLPVQGIRLTLDDHGPPAIWEMLADSSGAELIFVAQSLEHAAAAEFGNPLAGRRYSVERSLESAPNVVVPRVIDDGPMAMGPIVYLSAATHDVGTIICRCMPAQVKKLLDTRTYDLASSESAEPELLLHKTRLQRLSRPAFWPGEAQSRNGLEQCLRLPRTF